MKFPPYVFYSSFSFHKVEFSFCCILQSFFCMTHSRHMVFLVFFKLLPLFMSNDLHCYTLIFVLCCPFCILILYSIPLFSKYQWLQSWMRAVLKSNLWCCMSWRRDIFLTHDTSSMWMCWAIENQSVYPWNVTDLVMV